MQTGVAAAAVVCLEIDCSIGGDVPLVQLSCAWMSFGSASLVNYSSKPEGVITYFCFYAR
tara:strand:+ start:962 stop:1141 length:180 start_codon:yes stop_codon:yes gene_type:complete